MPTTPKSAHGVAEHMTIGSSANALREIKQAAERGLGIEIHTYLKRLRHDDFGQALDLITNKRTALPILAWKDKQWSEWRKANAVVIEHGTWKVRA